MRSKLLALAFVGLLAPAAWSGDTLTVDTLPTAVKATVLKESKGGTVESVEKVAAKEGHSNYVAHIKVGSKESTVTVAEDGHVIPEKKKK